MTADVSGVPNATVVTSKLSGEALSGEGLERRLHGGSKCRAKGRRTKPFKMGCAN